MSRDEKRKDKLNKDLVVAVYDMQAVMQLPKGEISLFYYTSKLNVCNLTVFNINTKAVDCYVWDEANSNRGAIEIVSSTYKYLENISLTKPNAEIVFWTDNCGGQQKNKFMVALYFY